MKKNLKVYIAGVRGFLGDNLVSSLKKKSGIAITAPSFRRNFNLTKLENCLSAVKGADIVINSAGIVTSRFNQAQRPAEILYINSLISFNLLESCRLRGINRFLGISSITAYPNNLYDRLKPPILFNGLAPRINESSGFYGVSRWLVPIMAYAYSLQFNIKCRIVIFPNLYGPKDKFDHREPPLIPSVIKNLSAAVRQNRQEFYGGNNKNQTIDLLYIDDAVEILLKMINKFGRDHFLCLNAGSGRAVTIGQVFKLVADCVGFNGKIKWGKNAKSSNRFLDNNDAERIYDWRPKINLQEGLIRTIYWFYKEKIRI